LFLKNGDEVVRIDGPNDTLKKIHTKILQKYLDKLDKKKKKKKKVTSDVPVQEAFPEARVHKNAVLSNPAVLSQIIQAEQQLRAYSNLMKTRQDYKTPLLLKAAKEDRNPTLEEKKEVKLIEDTETAEDLQDTMKHNLTKHFTKETLHKILYPGKKVNPKKLKPKLVEEAIVNMPPFLKPILSQDMSTHKKNKKYKTVADKRKYLEEKIEEAIKANTAQVEVEATPNPKKIVDSSDSEEGPSPFRTPKTEEKDPVIELFKEEGPNPFRTPKTKEETKEEKKQRDRPRTPRREELNYADNEYDPNDTDPIGTPRKNKTYVSMI
jgi:hypothetical protein